MDDEEKKGDPNAWALAFGDMITLLMTFFVMIISMSTIKMDDVAEEINAEEGLGDNIVRSELKQSGLFNNIVLSRTQLMMDENELPPPVSDLESVKDSMIVFITENDLTRVIDLEMTRKGFSIRISADILFDQDKSILKEDYMFLLNNISGLLSAIINNVRIDGHTDNSNSDNYYNRKLSIARATSVCNYLIDSNTLEPERFAVAGYASHKPLVPNNNAENLARNRRVEIVIKEISQNS